MENNTKDHTLDNNWEIGETVNIGFLKNLKITKKETNKYFLESNKGKQYVFIPYQGIYKL